MGVKCNSNIVEDLFNKLTIDIDVTNVPGYINHYYVQSEDDYMKRKINRHRDDIAEYRTIETDIFTKCNNITNMNILKYSSIIEKLMEIKSFGFIIIRNVNCSETNKLWIKCYESIRRFYNNKIIIIDDNSNMEYVTNYNTINTIIIKSEFPKRGEFLPYYYYLKNNLFKRAVVLHDSMEIVKYYDYDNITKYKNYTRLFLFGNASYSHDIEYFKDMCDMIKNGNLVYKYHLNNIKTLIGCFGVCYVIDWKFLNIIENKYNISNLIKFIDTRPKRKTLERFLSCLFEYERQKSFITCNDIFGNIHHNKNEYINKTYHGR
jgi:hypothetical protein